MPWKETGPMEERMKFVGLYLTGEWSMSVLCEAFGISRKTGYKWVNRYKGRGLRGLEELSRAARFHPNAVAAEIELAIVQVKQRWPKRGPKKLLWSLQQQRPDVSWPVLSTIGAVLKRHGLVQPRRRSRKSPPYEQPFAGIDQANAVWSADLKGWFMTGDNRRCDPLTITDNYSRYLIRCQAVQPVTEETLRPIFTGAPTMAPPLPQPPSAVCRGYRSGGLDSELLQNGSDPASPSRMVDTNGCIEPSRTKRLLRHRQPAAGSRRPLTASVRNITTNGLMKPWGSVCPRVCIFPLYDHTR